MMFITSEYCRLCLTSNNLVPIFENAKDKFLPDKISFHCSIDMKPNDTRYSTKICTRCEQKILFWDTFRQICTNNQRLIKGEETYENIHTSVEVKEESTYMDHSIFGAQTDESKKKAQRTTQVYPKDNIDILIDCDLNQNMTTANINRSCELTNAKFDQDSSKKKKRKTFKCKLCPRKFKSHQAANGHIGWHKKKQKEDLLNDRKTKKLRKAPLKQSQPEFLCSTCHLVLPNDKALKIHVLEKHGNMADSHLTPRCERCNREFSSMTEYENHQKVHERVELQKELVIYSCQYCSTLCITEEDLQSHIRSSHPEIFPVYKCEQCGTGFDKKTSLTNHVKVHRKQKAFVGTPKPLYFCPICNMGFQIPKELKTHTRKAHPF